MENIVFSITNSVNRAIKVKRPMISPYCNNDIQKRGTAEGNIGETVSGSAITMYNLQDCGVTKPNLD